MQKNWKSKLKQLLFAIMFLLVLSGNGNVIPVQAQVTSVEDVEEAQPGKFENTEDGWIYIYEDGTQAADCLLDINEKTYYFSEEGIRQYGWQEIDSKWYYFGSKSKGYMYKNAWIKEKGKNTYYVGSDGSRCTGWYTGKNTYYFDKKGRLVTGYKKIKGVKYRFDSKGRMTKSGPNFSLNSQCAILVEANSGKVIFSKNPDLRHANASTTKIMTAVLAVENCEMSEIVKTSKYAASQEPSKLYFKKGERFYMGDMLYSLLLPSHNDTAVAIAEHVGGSTKKFVKMMNEKAAELGCTNTHFATPNGLDAGLNHYTTARDMAKIASYAWQYSRIREIVGTRTKTIKNLKGKTYNLVSTNRLLHEGMAGIGGMKTGYTDKAGQCFVGVIKGLNGKTYISVTFGARTTDGRWADARKLLSYARNLK